MARWCRERGVELAPHGKTHMAPQLLARQFDAGACAITAATISQVRVFRAFGVRDVVLANELVDEAGLRWLAAELDADPDFAAGVLGGLGARRRVDDRRAAAAGAAGRSTCASRWACPAGGRAAAARTTVDEVARAAVASPRLRLVGVAGYEAALGHDVTARRLARGQLVPGGAPGGGAAARARCSRPTAPSSTAGGSTYFDAVADELTGWPDGLSVRTIAAQRLLPHPRRRPVRRTSPLSRRCTAAALSVWAQVVSRPEPDLAVLTMGRRDVSFDQDLPIPYGLSGSAVTKLNDQHAYLRLGGDDRVEVGDWVRVRDLPPLHGFRQVADDPGARRRRPRRRPDPHVLLVTRPVRTRASVLVQEGKQICDPWQPGLVGGVGIVVSGPGGGALRPLRRRCLDRTRRRATAGLVGAWAHDRCPCSSREHGAQCHRREDRARNSADAHCRAGVILALDGGHGLSLVRCPDVCGASEENCRAPAVVP